MSALVVSLYGGPGCGKSTLAYKLAGLLKQHGYNAELVVEYVKHSAYTEAKYELHDQIYLTAQHNHRLRILQSQVDVIITDASLLNCLAYATESESESVEKQLSIDLYNRYNNIGFILPRKLQYLTVGRTQTREEAVQLDDKIDKAISWLPENERIDLRSISLSDDGKLLLETAYNIVVDEIKKRKVSK